MANALLLTSAAALGNGPSAPAIRVTLSEDAGAELQLEAKRAPLARVLDEVAGKTGVRIHYSVLPEGLVTATCVGETVKAVIECLFDRKASLVVRYSGRSSKTHPQGLPAEVWILGTSLQASAGMKNADACASVEGASSSARKAEKVEIDAAQEATDELVTMARSQDPARRAEAVGRLLAGGRKGDVAVRQVLETALTDEDPKVRAQALTSLAIREGAGAAAALQQALHDSDVSVRLTAVARAGDNTALLQQALADSDASVRELAAQRLNPLAKPGAFQ